MKTILLVDDEPYVIQGLKRMLLSTSSNYQYLFAYSGKEALEIMRNVPVNMVISDIRMPEMDGAQLLERVKTEHPDVVRIILSGHSDKDAILRSAGVAHQFLVKPCNPDFLNNTIDKAFCLREFINNEEIAGLVTGVSALPGMSSSFGSLIKELNSNDTSLKGIGDIISKDPTMTAKVLQLVNSAFFGIPRKVSTVQQAVTLLGINTLKALAMYVGVFTTSKPAGGDEPCLSDLWNHSLLVGKAAKYISLSQSKDERLSEEAYVGGVLHDIGKVLLTMVPKYHLRLTPDCSLSRSSLELEYELLNTSHAEAGAYLLGLWGVPDNLVEMVAFHHFPGKAMDKKFSNLTAVHIANGLVVADSMGCEYSECLDLNYLESIDVITRLAEWADDYRAIIKE